MSLSRAYFVQASVVHWSELASVMAWEGNAVRRLLRRQPCRPWGFGSNKEGESIGHAMAPRCRHSSRRPSDGRRSSCSMRQQIGKWPFGSNTSALICPPALFPLTAPVKYACWFFFLSAATFGFGKCVVVFFFLPSLLCPAALTWQPTSYLHHCHAQAITPTINYMKRGYNTHIWRSS